MTGPFRRCGRPDCKLCRWNDDQYQDSGHPVDEPLAISALGIAAIVLLAIVAFIILPGLAS